MSMVGVANATTEFIMGGNDVRDRAEYPYVVSLQYKSTYFFLKWPKLKCALS